ncbi:MAG: type II secretion system protein GspD, partial [Phycisphaerales bacterium]
VINEILAEPEPDLRALDDVLSSDGGTRLSATSANTRIVADPSRNQLIIRAPVRVHEQLSRIIDQLDRPRPQVLVEVRIVSLTTTDDFEFSADVQVQAGQFSFLSALGVTTPGTTIESPVTVGAATRSGLTAAVIKSDFVPIAINALQRIGDARIVSTPQILVNDNQEGNIRSVREEPTEVTNQQTGVPAQTSQGPSVEAGTELVVRPQIAGDGSVVLNFAIEVSSFDTAARRGNLTPPKQTEAYNSVVSVPSNSTIIVGGFRFEELGKSILKIPILGDIPLVGELFRSTNTRDQSRIIYVFITPTVISETGQRDLRLLTDGPLRDADIREGLPSLRPAMVPLSSIRIDQIRPDLDLGAGVDQRRPARSTSRARTDWD